MILDELEKLPWFLLKYFIISSKTIRSGSFMLTPPKYFKIITNLLKSITSFSVFSVVLDFIEFGNLDDLG